MKWITYRCPECGNEIELPEGHEAVTFCIGDADPTSTKRHKSRPMKEKGKK